MFALRNTATKSFRSSPLRAFHVSSRVMTVTEIESKESFREQVLKSPIAFVDAYAVWCGPCKMIAPYIDKFSDRYTSINFFKFDVEQVPEVSHELGISAMPTFIVYKHGKEFDRIVGANPQGINAALMQAIATEEK